MKAKPLFLTIAVLLGVVGLWLAPSGWRMPAFHKSSKGVGLETRRDPHVDPNPAGSLPEASLTGPAFGANQSPQPGRRLRPPEPTRRFTDFTPEQRVQFARQGHGPGG